MIATEAMNFFVEQGVDASETRSSMSLIKEVDERPRLSTYRGGRFSYGSTVSCVLLRNARHQNTRLRRVFVTKVGDYRSQANHLWSYETISTRRCYHRRPLVCHLHGSALPDPSRDLSSPSDFSRNDFPRPKSHIIHENAINLSMQMTRNQETHLRSPSYFFWFLHHIQAKSCCPVSLCQGRRTFREFLGVSSALDVSIPASANNFYWDLLGR